MRIVLKKGEKVVDAITDRATFGKNVVVDASGKVVKVVTVTGPGKTEQMYGELLNINKLVEPAQRKGLLRHVTKFEGEYDDIPVADFQEAQFIVAKANSMFEALPSSIRTRFENDPGKFMSFVQNPKNEDWLREHGIVKGLDGLDDDGNPTGYIPTVKEASKDPADVNPPPEVSAE